MRRCDKFRLKGPMLCQIHFTDSFEQQWESSLEFSVLAFKTADARPRQRCKSSLHDVTKGHWPNMLLEIFRLFMIQNNWTIKDLKGDGTFMASRHSLAISRAHCHLQTCVGLISQLTHPGKVCLRLLLFSGELLLHLKAAANSKRERRKKQSIH